MNRRSFLTRLAPVMALVARPAAATASPEETTRKPGPRADYFPNVLLQTHDGREVRFYDDLINGKVVAISQTSLGFDSGGGGQA
ncbi:MAG: hypothetical protein EOP84_03570, partial [Verrucomicrobiaceae bacterium]